MDPEMQDYRKASDARSVFVKDKKYRHLSFPQVYDLALTDKKVGEHLFATRNNLVHLFDTIYGTQKERNYYSDLLTLRGDVQTSEQCKEFARGVRYGASWQYGFGVNDSRFEDVQLKPLCFNSGKIDRLYHSVSVAGSLPKPGTKALVITTVPFWTQYTDKKGENIDFAELIDFGSMNQNTLVVFGDNEFQVFPEDDEDEDLDAEPKFDFTGPVGKYALGNGLKIALDQAWERLLPTISGEAETLVSVQTSVAGPQVFDNEGRFVKTGTEIAFPAENINKSFKTLPSLDWIIDDLLGEIEDIDKYTFYEPEEPNWPTQFNVDLVIKYAYPSPLAQKLGVTHHNLRISLTPIRATF